MRNRLCSEERVGERYGKLVIMGVADTTKHTHTCLCDCGNTHIATIYNLRKGNVKSCGCLLRSPPATKAFHKTHGLAHTPEYKMWQTSKRRAKERGLSFDLEPEDITIPTTCPVLGIPLRQGFADKGLCDDSPSIDRYDNTKGYTKENIRIISMKANRIKGTATIDDIEAVLRYMKGE